MGVSASNMISYNVCFIPLFSLFQVLVNPGREGTLGCLFQKFPKFYHNVFLFVCLTTLGTFIEFCLVYSLSLVVQTFYLIQKGGGIIL